MLDNPCRRLYLFIGGTHPARVKALIKKPSVKFNAKRRIFCLNVRLFAIRKTGCLFLLAFFQFDFNGFLGAIGPDFELDFIINFVLLY